MNTTAINVSTKLYKQVSDYARQHNTSVEEMTEGFLLNLLMTTKDKETYRIKHSLRQLDPELQWLGSLSFGEFSQRELDEDPRLAAIVEDRRERK
ncbi:MAG: hypothetical protein IJ200_04105 [Prevotella sp.]|nr:hypothetical protein [Prevotella sp.]